MAGGGQTTHNLKIVLTGDAAGLQASLQAAGVDLARVQSTGAATSTTLGTIGGAAAEAAREIGSATTAAAVATSTIGAAGAALAEAARSVGQVGAATRTAAQALDVAARSGGQAAAQFALLGNSAGGAGGQVERMSLRAGAALQALVGNAQRGTAAAAAAAKAAEDAANAAKGTGIQAGAAVEAVAGRLAQLTAGMRQGVTSLERGAAAGVASAGRFGAAAQQAGYQIGDFAVQVSSGQSAITAFLQQGTQMLQFFGPLGAVVGATMAVAGGLAVGLMNAGGGATAAEKATRALTAAQEELSLSMAASLQDVEALASEYARMTREAQSLEMALLSVEQRRQQKALEANLAAFKEAMTAALEDATSGQRLLWEDEKERIRQADDVVTYFEEVNARIKNAGSNPEVFTGLADAAAPFAAIARDLGQAAEETATQIEALGLATSGAASATERLGTVSSSLGTFIDRAAGAKDAAPGLRDLAQSMRLLEGIKLEKDAFEALTSGVISERQYTAITEAIGRFVKEGDAAFKKATGGAAAFTSAVDNQRAKLLEVVDTFIRADSAAARYYQSVTVASQKLSADQARELAGLKALGEALKGLQRAAGQLDGAAGAVQLDGVSSAIGKLATLSKEIAEYRAEVDAARAAVDAAALSEDRRTAALTALEGSVKKLGEAEAVYVQGLRHLAATTAAEAEEIEYKNQLLALELRGYDGASEAVARLVRERELHALALERETALNALNTKLLTADVEAQQAIRDEIAQTTAAYERLFEAKAVQQALQDQRRMVEAELKGPMGQAFANFAGEMEDNFKEAWKEAFKAGEGGFERLMDGFEDMFLDMLAELAFQALVKPIIVPVLQEVGTALGLSQAATNRALGVQGGPVAGGGGFGLPGFGGEGLFSSDFFTKPWVSVGGNVHATTAATGADLSAFGGAGPTVGTPATFQFGASQALGAAGFAFSAYNFAKSPSLGSGLGALGSGAALASSLSPALAAAAPWLGPAGIALAVAAPLLDGLMKREKHPAAGADIVIGSDGQLTTGRLSSKHMGTDAIEGVAKGYIEALQTVLDGMGITGGLNVGHGASIGYDQKANTWSVHNGGKPVADYDTPEAAFDDLGLRIIKGMAPEAIGADIATAIRNSAATTLSELAADVDFARSRDTLFDVAEAQGALEGSARTLVAAYDAAVDRAEALGLSTDAMTDGFVAALKRLAEPEAAVGPFTQAMEDAAAAMEVARAAAGDAADDVAAAWERAKGRIRASLEQQTAFSLLDAIDPQAAALVRAGAELEALRKEFLATGADMRLYDQYRMVTLARAAESDTIADTISALEDNIGAHERWVAAARAARDDLRLSAETSPYSIRQRMDYAESRYREAAAANDNETMLAMGREWVALAREYSGNQALAVAVFEEVDSQFAALETAEQKALRLADDQLSQLQAANDNLAGIRSALADLDLSAGARQWSAPGKEGNAAINMALARATGFTGNFGGGAFSAWIEAQDERVKAAGRAVLSAAGRQDLIYFAEGGEVAGGIPGVDSVPSMLMPGERVLTTEQNRIFSRLAAAELDVRPVVAAIEASTRATVGAVYGVHAEIRRLSDENTALRREIEVLALKVAA